MNLKSSLNALIIIISLIALVYFCLSENGFSDLIFNIKNLNIFWFIMSFISHFLNITIDSIIIFILTKNIKNDYKFKQALKTCAVGQFFSSITPGGVAGQPMQVYSMSKQNVSTGNSSSVLIQRFLIYQTTITIYGLIFILWKRSYFTKQISKMTNLLMLIGLASHAFIIFLLLIFSLKRKFTENLINIFIKLISKLKLIKNPEKQILKIKTQLDSFHKNNSELYKNSILLLKLYLLTIVQLFCIFVIPYLIYRAFNFNQANIFDILAAQSFVMMCTSLFPMPGGAGAAEISFFAFFSNFFINNTLKPAMLLWRIITYFLTILVTAPFSRIKKHNESIQ
ncbi:MAG: flippase-like domain-containing protein [Candidatus Paraimprobicoccus trichonymphae]|uniref:Phosphatidylglycerol lysyltransferase n=1 Tax=Candidatus Paraimprobicoccus trichonymphae TaxID=3033793 RepID=A0AA48KXU0_9FIRM|nr:MAG: flippase-like domain-containing protein [Candidatus Paraimprobicoccus trichonymphae]